jgi:hypothetical protein
MTRELLLPLLAIVILVNAGVIAYAVGSRGARAPEQLGPRGASAATSALELAAPWLMSPYQPAPIPRYIRGFSSALASVDETAARPVPAGVWAASTLEVRAGRAGPAAAGGAPDVQSCAGCGISLSAKASFCRRCGTRQA